MIQILLEYYRFLRDAQNLNCYFELLPESEEFESQFRRGGAHDRERVSRKCFSMGVWEDSAVNAIVATVEPVAKRRFEHVRQLLFQQNIVWDRELIWELPVWVKTSFLVNGRRCARLDVSGVSSFAVGTWKLVLE